MKLKGMFWRQFALTAGMVLLTLLLLGVCFFGVTYTTSVRTQVGEMTTRAEIIASLSGDFINAIDDDNTDAAQAFSSLVEVSSRMTDVIFHVTNLDGNVLLTTDKNLAGKPISIPKEIVEKVIAGEESYRELSTLGDNYAKKEYVVGVPIEKDSHTLGVVFAIVDTTEITQMWKSFLMIFLVIGGAILLISLMATYIVASREIKPMEEMVKAIQSYAEGNFDIRMKEDPDDSEEIRVLSESFNAMADSLQETERQRRDFVANVSHELKTPMTTIAGYTDGILDGTIPPEKEKQYLQVISDESRRLSRLVRRMLDISQIQANGIKQQNFDICESCRVALLSLERRITDRGLNVDAEIPDLAMMCTGDQELITQAVYNLLENATKYASPKSTIYLGVAKEGEKAVVSVRNEGQDISAEEIPLIFERFHKSDKSRSVDKDGYGLGLYVVKTIVDMHKENIICISENGLTTFSFTLQLGK